MLVRSVPRLQRRGRGDLIVTIIVDTPLNLSKEEKELLIDLAQIRNEPTSEKKLRSRKRR